ncbi:MAG: aminotransferase class I/II-fold pyridoxal phosphate-dependent enzyme [Nitriliruptoraceae bacterium]
MAARLAAHLDGHGLSTAPERLLVTGGLRRALDVVLASLLRPGDRVLVPALTDPAWLALLAVRGFHPVPLPVDLDGRADLPGWLRRIRGRSASVALLTATYAPPAGTVLQAHERQLLVEEAVRADVTLIDDLSHADLWLEDPPPAPLAAPQAPDEERIVTVGSTDALTAGAPLVGWIRAPEGPVTDRLAGVLTALDAAPSGLTVAAADAAFADHAGLLRTRRQHLADLAATAIRLVTPAAPRITVAPPSGGPRLWLRFQGATGTEVADLARQQGLLVHPGAASAVDGSDHPAVGLALTADTDDVVAGLRILVRIAGAAEE